MDYLTRSMPRRASSPSTLSFPHTASFPMHTWCSFAPISAPHSQAGRLSTTAYVWATCSISIYVHWSHDKENNWIVHLRHGAFKFDNQPNQVYTALIWSPWKKIQLFSRYLNFFFCFMFFGREVDHLLNFIAGSVRVLPEDYPLTLCRWRQGYKSVAGGWIHPEIKRCKQQCWGRSSNM